MLAEVLVYLFTPASRSTRKLGLLKDSVNLWARGRRLKKSWQPHYYNCHGVVEKAVSMAGQHRTVLVLGSGPCRDIPLQKLVNCFERVVLVDVVHVWPVRLRWAVAKNIMFQTLDLTGYHHVLTGQTSVRVNPLKKFTQDLPIDLVISANCLSQLPLVADDEDLARHIVRWHLEDLKAFSCPVCLLTDVFYQVFNQNDETLEKHDLMYGMSLPKPDQEWDWAVAPHGESSKGASHVHRVYGYSNYSQI